MGQRMASVAQRMMRVLQGADQWMARVAQRMMRVAASQRARSLRCPSRMICLGDRPRIPTTTAAAMGTSVMLVLRVLMMVLMTLLVMLVWVRVTIRPRGRAFFPTARGRAFFPKTALTVFAKRRRCSLRFRPSTLGKHAALKCQRWTCKAMCML
eukprot:Rmarinus@m.1934